MNTNMWFDGFDWYIAESADEALKLQNELSGEDWTKDENEFKLVDPESELTFMNAGKRATKKTKEWLAGRTKGFFGSTEH